MKAALIGVGVMVKGKKPQSLRRIWYPSKEFLLEAHNLMLRKFGGYPGLRSNGEVFKSILIEVKKTRGIYRKAAVLLRKLRTANIFQDGNKRTAYVLTKAFLEMNGKKMWTEDLEETYTFIHLSRISYPITLMR